MSREEEEEPVLAVRFGAWRRWAAEEPKSRRRRSRAPVPSPLPSLQSSSRSHRRSFMPEVEAATAGAHGRARWGRGGPAGSRGDLRAPAIRAQHRCKPPLRARARQSCSWSPPRHDRLTIARSRRERRRCRPAKREVVLHHRRRPPRGGGARRRPGGVVWERETESLAAGRRSPATGGWCHATGNEAALPPPVTSAAGR
ncbi:unnamed protein product [Urochloa humidicola]